MTSFKKWLKPLLLLFVLFLLVYFLPTQPIDPWNILSLQKIVTVVFALVFIQVLGAVLIHLLGYRSGAILTGFFGGLISSTATTAALARKSRLSSDPNISLELLTFLSTTLAMFCEGVFIVLVGTENLHLSLLFIFLGPILALISMIFMISRNFIDPHLQPENIRIDIFPILKMSVFILAILALSKISENIFGQNGLMLVTFIVSLFEIHGSLIANLQLHNAGVFNLQLLGSLFALSAFAATISKLFLILTLGSPLLQRGVLKSTTVLILSLGLGWGVFQFFL